MDRSDQQGFLCAGDVVGNPCGDIAVTTSAPWSSNFLNGPFTSDTVVATFSSPVTHVDIDAGKPVQFACTDDRFVPTVCTAIGAVTGQVIAFDARGTEIDRQPFVAEPDPFSDDVISSASVGTGVPIARVLIVPGEPLAWVLGFDLFQSPATLQVACTPATVVRGASVSCAASASDGSAPANIAWKFTAADSSIGAITGPSTLTWSGPMVVSGAVEASATLGGASQTASAAVTVQPRDWSTQTIDVTITPLPTPYGDPPKDVHELGSNVMEANLRVDGISVIADGPNTGLAFFTALPFTASFRVNFNEKAMRVGSQFYSMQPRTSRVFQGVRYCGQDRVTGDIDLVKKHEGFSATDPNSHTDVYLRTFLAQVRGPAERLVAPAADLTAGPLRDAAHKAAAAESHRVTDGAGNPYVTDCVFNFDQSLRIP